MKKILTALCLILLLGLWGCGEQTNGTQAATESKHWEGWVRIF